MEMRTPLILVNFKTEREAFGDGALRLASVCESLSSIHGVNICIAPHLLDLQNVGSRVKIPIFAQHFHPIGMGKATGHIPAESLKLAGASGVIINHCEKPLPMNEIKERVEMAKAWGLTSIVCAANADVAADVARFGPDFISYESPEYIGSSTASVSTAKPEILKKAISAVAKVSPGTKVLCGAGISTEDDMRKAMELGSCGILVSRAVVKAEDPAEVIGAFCKAIHESNCHVKTALH